MPRLGGKEDAGLKAEQKSLGPGNYGGKVFGAGFNGDMLMLSLVGQNLKGERGFYAARLFEQEAVYGGLGAAVLFPGAPFTAGAFQVRASALLRQHVNNSQERYGQVRVIRL